MGTYTCRPRPAQTLPPVPRPNARCITTPQEASPEKCSTSGCISSASFDGSNIITSSSHNLSLDELCNRLGKFGPLDTYPCYTYVIDTVELEGNGEVKQTASAPNFSGGYITLCTCKHLTRTMHSPKEWSEGVWLAGMTGSGNKFKYQQSLAFLMRVAEAYPSHFDLVQALRATGRMSTLDAKDSRHNRNGDLMIPQNTELTPSQRVMASFYLPPMIGHAHRQSEDDTHWHEDIDYVDSRSGKRPALLVGDPRNSFTWSRQMILNTGEPGALRYHRKWSLRELLGKLSAA
jgi:hypothetical protein